MGVRYLYQPLRAGLFFYECLRLFCLVFILLVASGNASISGTYSVYMSPNALFTLMALFIWLKPEEYANYTTLYIAGKIIALVSFYVWEIFSFREFARSEDLVRSIVILGGSALISLADMLSIWGAWMLNKDNRKAIRPDSGGL